MDIGHWELRPGLQWEPEAYGFIYEITNLTTGQMYIGKKQMQSKRKLPPLKGKKRKRTKIVETDWKTYTGSCTQLNEDIEKIGKQEFEFDIVCFCNSKWELAYKEAEMQINRGVLLSESYYNGIINVRIPKKPKSYGK